MVKPTVKHVFKKTTAFFFTLLFILNINLPVVLAQTYSSSLTHSVSHTRLHRTAFIASAQPAGSSALANFVNALPFQLNHGVVYGALGLLFFFGIGTAFGGVMIERKYAKTAKRAANAVPAPSIEPPKAETIAEELPDGVASSQGEGSEDDEDEEATEEEDDEDIHPHERNGAFHSSAATYAKYELAISGGDVGLIRYLPQTSLVEINISGVRMLEYDIDDTLSAPLDSFKAIFHPDDKHLLESYLLDESNCEVGNSFEIELRAITHDDLYHWFLFKFTCLYDKTLDTPIYTGAFFSIDNMKKFERKMNLLAFRDTVTKTLNKPKLMIETERIISDATRQNQNVYVLFIDIDSFKAVNSQKGDGIGDKLLREVSRYIQQELPPDAVLGRQSGDEFVVAGIFEGEAENPPEVLSLVERLQASVSTIQAAPYGLNVITFCVGISIFPKDGTTSFALFEQASLSLIAAKESGKGSIRFYDQEIIDSIKKREHLKADMKTDAFFEQLELYYQPKVEAATGTVIGAEALIRWNHPSYGLVQPNTFITIAEQTGIISDIDWWCLKECCQQVVTWQNQGYRPIHFSVNISANILYDENMVSKIKTIIADAAIDPGYLDLELTERMTVQHLAMASDCLKQLRKFGVTVSIDDFGTGYSSLNYLHRLPADYIKIDRSFISDLETDPYVRLIVTTLINLSKDLGMRTVAEGVETDYQRKFVVEAGCNFIQGYFFGRPVKSADFEHSFLISKENS